MKRGHTSLHGVSSVISADTESKRMCALDHFCYCLALRLGAFVVGAVYVFLSINTFLLYYGVYTFYTDQRLSTAHLVFAVIYLIAALLLLIGVIFEKKWLVKPWVVMMSAAVLIYLITITILVIKSYKEDTMSGFTNILLLFLHFSIHMYCLAVVCSYGQKIGDEEV